MFSDWTSSKCCRLLLCMVLMLIERDKSNPYTFIMGKGEWWTQENYFIQL